MTEVPNRHRLGPLVLAPWQRAWLETFLGPRFAPEHGIDYLSAWLDTVTVAAPPPTPVPDLDELFAQARAFAKAAEGRPVCFAANTATIRRLAEHVIRESSAVDTLRRPTDPAWLFALPLYVDDDLPDDVVEPRTTHPTRPTEETAP